MGSDGNGSRDYAKYRVDSDYTRTVKSVSPEQFRPGKPVQISSVEFRVTFGNCQSDWSKPSKLLTDTFMSEEIAMEQAVDWVSSVDEDDNESEMMAIVSKVETTVTTQTYVVPESREI